MGFENSKNAAQFPFMQPKNTSLVPNITPFIDFGLTLVATGRVEPTIRISVVIQPLNFSFFNRVPSPKVYAFWEERTSSIYWKDFLNVLLQ